MNSLEVSERFVRYYQNLGFELLPSAPLLHPSTPMTFVMSAGLAQVETSRDQLEYRAGSSYVLRQKCFRHFDLSSIGKSNVHLSLFEMPGAFVFGPIAKTVTIQRMWSLITEALEIRPDRLRVTYFGGGTKGGHCFPVDMESYQAWRQLGLPEDHIVALGAEDNFWMQGGGIDGQESRRKCGPNTEVFLDRGESFGCGLSCRPGCRCGRFVEFANSLFIFAEMDVETGTLKELERPFGETVIGTERAAMVAQGKASVFDTDCIRPLVEQVRSFCNGVGSEADTGSAQQIISDYVRALLFLVADGAPPPGKGGRQRIVKLLIRGVLTQQEILKIAAPDFLPELVDTIVSIYGAQYPELADGKRILLDYFASEHSRFQETLSRGYRHLDRMVGESRRAPAAEQLVNLVKELGVPLALVRMKLRQKGIEADATTYLLELARWQETHLD